MDKQNLLHPRYKKSRRSQRAVSTSDTAFVNCLLTFAVIVSLWVLWSPDSDGHVDENSYASSPRQMATSMMQAQGDQYQQLIPVFRDGNGRHYVLSQHLQKAKEIAAAPSPVSANTRGASSNSVGVGSNVPSRTVDHEIVGAGKPNLSTETKASKQSTNDQKAGASRTLTSLTESIEGGSRTLPQSIQRMTFLIVASCSIVLGALSAKRALEKAQQWEQQSQEDSLAYDMAYTDTRSDYSYGSFISTVWSDELDKFDV